MAAGLVTVIPRDIFSLWYRIAGTRMLMLNSKESVMRPHNSKVNFLLIH